MTQAGLVPDGVEIDRPSVARLYDYFLGGTHNFAADRELARRLLEAEPNARQIVAENRKFLGRAVRFLIDAGIRQFIDLGSGIPTQENVHQIAQRASADARVVYVDNDPVAVAHSKQILRGNELATVIKADLREPDSVFGSQQVRDLIDVSQPVGMLMVTVLHFVPDGDDPVGIVSGYAARLASGSYLAISHATADAAPKAAAVVQELYKGATASAFPRTHAHVSQFFTGFDLVEPGLVYLPAWRPDGPPPEHPEEAWFYAGAGRKP